MGSVPVSELLVSSSCSSWFIDGPEVPKAGSVPDRLLYDTSSDVNCWRVPFSRKPGNVALKELWASDNDRRPINTLRSLGTDPENRLFARLKEVHLRTTATRRC